MDKTVPAKCPYCGCGNILVERSLEGYCRCHRCKETFIDKTLPLKLTIKDIDAELAAANARVAELEKQKPSYKAEFDCMYEKFKAEESLSEHYKQRAEQAEAKAKRLIKKLTYNTPSFRDGERDEELLTIDENELVPLKSCMCDRLKQVEAQAAAMRIGLEKIKSLVAEAAGKGDALCYEIYIWVCESGANNANNAGTAILADNKRMREALEKIRNCVTTHVPSVAVHAIDYIAKAALEGKP